MQSLSLELFARHRCLELAAHQHQAVSAAEYDARLGRLLEEVQQAREDLQAGHDSAQQALAQCRGWLREFMRDVELIGVSSNAVGARRARDEQGTAAIGGDTAAEVYGLNVLVNNIEDSADNATRFLVIGRGLLAASGDDKTTILVSASHTDRRAGVLHTLLEPFADKGVNMTRIESRPSRKKNWDYVFFFDLDGHAEESPLAEALAELQERSSLFRILGAYPKAVN